MKEKRELNIVGKRKIFFLLSSILVVVAIASSFIFGIKLDIQFTGGSISTYSYENELDIEKFKSFVENNLDKKIKIQETTDIATNKKNVVVSLNNSDGLSNDVQLKLNESIKTEFKDNNINLENTSNVDASIGREFLSKSLIAVGFAALVMVIYIALRFKRISGWSAGVVSVIALIHDVIMVYATFIIFNISINDNFIAVILTILGYSINDTIVIYDRIRENKKLFGNKLNSEQLVNKSINQSLRRSINTTISTVVAMLVVCIVSLIFGVTSIISFALPLIVGMISGVYSTICIAGPLWVSWQNRSNKKSLKPKNVKTKKLANI